MSLLDAARHAIGAPATDVEAPIAPLGGRLPSGRLVGEAVSFAALCLDEWSGTRAASTLDPERIATAVTSERHFRRNGEKPGAWAPLSGFHPAADGWMRTHANYPHHRDRLLEALDLRPDSGVDDLRRRLSGLPASEAEQRITAAGGVAAAVRTESEWLAEEQAPAVDATPLLGFERTGDAAAHDSSRPRILDLTRVLAGPVATRTLALWGADVLRVDPPTIPEIEWQHQDTGAGKRTTVLDVRSARFAELLAEADVLVHGYRPGTLDLEALARRHPSLVVASISAWGAHGPWAHRRGFDSIVQAATGIAVAESADGRTPGALPAQALDHSAGYLLAGGVAAALRRREREGGGWRVQVSLARLAHELLRMPRVATEQARFTPTTVRHGDLEYPRPALGPDDFAFPPRAWGADPAEWG
ncbi:CoA transferase family III [Diaminobutyricimonas aerilata]|uniref:CoA transferase family III n=1 Tax=Diaminobutyricimonas aerilata TaxID=1162967 RepID=A0A2M9CGD9_9MICO|nr:CoA transferase [Diaminobutyricimonas aerilata]PJJ70948.1 CoA transferase family III [Diaminobutyricimonas aerilata]